MRVASGVRRKSTQKITSPAMMNAAFGMGTPQVRPPGSTAGSWKAVPEIKLPKSGGMKPPGEGRM
jgi:hypothetical protein